MKIAKIMFQDILLQLIRRKIGEKSLNDEIANVLNISYDAAHRRCSGKSKLSIDETVLLCQYYDISFDNLFLSQEQIIVKKSGQVHHPKEILHYFQHSLQTLQNLKTSSQAKIYYSALDIPFFYTISDTVLSKFKMYVWFNLVNETQFSVPFDQFSKENPSAKSDELKEFYENLEVVEIWNQTTISSLLYQINFYTEIGNLSLENAQIILDDLVELLEYIEQKIITKEGKFQLYANELLTLSNNFVLVTPEQNTLCLPYNIFGYLISHDEETCQESLQFFEQQIKNSRSLNFAGNRDRKMFFNQLYRKIEDFRKQLMIL